MQRSSTGARGPRTRVRGLVGSTIFWEGSARRSVPAWVSLGGLGPFLCAHSALGPQGCWALVWVPHQ
eukprot:1105151-Pyramimonas_sp.AAC.1